VTRKAFYSFHYEADSHRASQVRNMGLIEGSQTVSDNKWEEITRSGETAIKKWIGDQMTGKSCVIVLIGSETAGRKWINYEIEQAWNNGKGILGIHIHRLKNLSQQQSTKGVNPFSTFTIGQTKRMDSVVKTYDPPHLASTEVYSHISKNIAAWVEDAITIRSRY
jgi:hypothetical protein